MPKYKIRFSLYFLGAGTTLGTHFWVKISIVSDGAECVRKNQAYELKQLFWK